MRKIFSTFQIGYGSYLGGPFAAIYFLKKNFDTMGKEKEAQNTFVLGIIGSIALLFTLPFLPDTFPNSLLPIIYTSIAVTVATKYDMGKNISEYGDFDFFSAWKVLGISIICMIALFALACGIIIAFDMLGLATL